jgi:hypothetical protein
LPHNGAASSTTNGRLGRSTASDRADGGSLGRRATKRSTGDSTPGGTAGSRLGRSTTGYRADRSSLGGRAAERGTGNGATGGPALARCTTGYRADGSSLGRRAAERGTGHGAQGGPAARRLGRAASDCAEGSALGSTPLTADGTADDGSPGGASQALSDSRRVCADPAAEGGCDQTCETKSRSHDVFLLV